MNRNRSWLFLVLLLILIQPLCAQSNWQWEGGVSFSLGQPTNQIGFSVRLKYYQGPIGINATIGSWYRLSGLGAPGDRWENRFGLGPSIGFKAKDTQDQESAIFFPRYKTELTYLFLRYQEKYTAQFSGRLEFRVNDLSVNLENDFLGWMGKDRFRTGTLELAYSQGTSQVAIEMALWTGETRCAAVKRAELAGARFGAKLINDCPYGKISHGLLRLKYSAQLFPNQQVSFSFGIDDERIRHLIQNKLMHDGVLRLNKKVKNPHFPMLDESGMPVINKDRQEVRKARLAWAFELNRWSIY